MLVIGAAEIEPVIARTANQAIGAMHTTAAEQRIVARAANQTIVVRIKTGFDGIIARAAFEPLLREAASQRVLAFATVGRRSGSIDALLAAHGARSGVFVTAWNPGSRTQDEAANRAANARLQAELAPWRHLPHEGVGDGGWREEGFFVLDLPEGTAVELARRFGQVAIVAVLRAEPARLAFTGVAPAQ